MESAAIGILVLFAILLATALAGLWIAALVDVVRGQQLDETARLILGLLLIFVAPVGMVVWVVVRRSLWRTGLVLTLGLGLGLTAAVLAAMAIDRAPQRIVTASSQAGASVSVPAHSSVTAP
jgi:hypothetical protein